MALQSRRSVLEKMPFLIIMGASAAITFVSQARAAGIKDTTEQGPFRIPLILCHNIIFYLYKLVWPSEMSAQYPFPQPLGLSDPMIRVGVFGSVTLMAVLLVSWRWTRAPLVGWLFFFVAIFPTMGVIGFTFVIAWDKFAYLPSIGLLMVLCWFAVRLWSAPTGRVQSPACRVGAVLALVLLIGAEARATRRYLWYWQETERFHHYQLTVTPGAYGSRFNLGLFLEEQGRFDEALQEFSRILRDDPGNAKARGGVGRMLMKKGRSHEAIPHLEEAIRIQPDFVLRYNLGLALYRQGQIEESVTHYRAAIQLDPNRFDVHLNLGNALNRLGRYDEAIEQYDEALRLKPNYARTHCNRGLALRRLGREEEAIMEYRKALVFDPNYALARRQLEETLKRRSAEATR